MSEKKENVSEIVSRWIGAIAEAADAKKSKITPDTLEARVQKLGETKHTPVESFETRIQREQREAKEFTDAIQSNQKNISLVMEQWKASNKYEDLLPLDKAKNKLKTAWSLSKNQPTWSGISSPEQIEYSAAAAEYLSTVALLPQELAEDPNVFFHETAKFAASMSSDPLAREEELKILNQAIIHQEKLKGFTLSKEDTIYTLRGFVLYDKELDGDILDPVNQVEAKNFLTEIQGRIETRKTGGISAQDEAMYLKRQGDTIAASDYYVIDNIHPSQKYQIKDKKVLEPFERRINRRVAELTEINKAQRQAEYQSRTFEGAEFNTPEELKKGIEAHFLRFEAPTEEIKEKMLRLSPEDQEKFKKEIIKGIRKTVERLENNPENWRIGGIEPLPRSLMSWMLILEDMGDHKLYEKIHIETEARSCQHVIYETLKKGGSPSDMKDFQKVQGDFDKMEFQEAITHIPGMAKTQMLLDERYERVIKGELNPVEKQKVKDEILTILRDDKTICDTEHTGITPEAALELATRHYFEQGRDGFKYREYIRKHHLLGTTKDKHGNTIWVVDPNAPLKWDPYRLLYCPEAMPAFFKFGSSQAGDVSKLTLPNGKTIEAVFAQGVGADFYKSLLDHGFDLKVTDYVSRRRDYELEAWISEQLDTKQERGGSSQVIWELGSLKRDERGEDSIEWNALQREIMTNDPTLGELRSFQRQEIRLSYNIKFADEFGVNVWSAYSENEKNYLQNVQTLRTKASNQGRTDIVQELDALKDRYTATLARAREINDKFKKDVCEKNGIKLEEYEFVYGDFFPSLAKFDESKIPWMRVGRLQENKRGNYRDHINALTPMQQVADCAIYPSEENILKVDHKAMCGYTTLTNAQKHLMYPVLQAYIDVQRGKGPFGSEVTSLLEVGKSKVAKAYDQKSKTDLDIYKIVRQLVAKGALSRDVAYKIRGGFAGRVRDKILEYADPASLVILLGAIVQEEAKKTQKDLEKG